MHGLQEIIYANEQAARISRARNRARNVKDLQAKAPKVITQHLNRVRGTAK
jgi:hypothetical protein